MWEFIQPILSELIIGVIAAGLGVDNLVQRRKKNEVVKTVDKCELHNSSFLEIAKTEGLKWAGREFQKLLKK